jgi:hypothetical protein
VPAPQAFTLTFNRGEFERVTLPLLTALPDSPQSAQLRYSFLQASAYVRVRVCAYVRVCVYMCVCVYVCDVSHRRAPSFWRV